jgi:myosin heavy chain 9/10/11/14
MAHNTVQKRNNPFARNTSPSPSPSGSRPKSAIVTSTLATPQVPSHNRHQSYSILASTAAPNGDVQARNWPNSKNGTPTSNTFAPSFIRTDEVKRGPEPLNGIDGENDFSGKRYVWLKDSVAAFVKGWIVEELDGNRILVQCDDGSVSIFHLSYYKLK